VYHFERSIINGLEERPIMELVHVVKSCLLAFVTKLLNLFVQISS